MKKKTTCPKTLLIGSGSLALHLRFYCKQLGWQIHTSLSAVHKTRNLQSTLPQLYLWNRRQTTALTQELLEEFDQVWLAISDSVLQDFIHTNLKRYKGSIIHFSGAMEVPGSISVHPLMTFTKKLYPRQVYPQITWVHTQRFAWNKHFPLFSNPHFQIKREHKVPYHLLCVMLGNFTQILLNSMTDQFSRIGINKKHLHLYINQIFQNQQSIGWAGLTGPLVRNDQKTIQSHLKILSIRNENRFFSPSQKKLYRRLYLDFQSLYQQRISQ